MRKEESMDNVAWFEYRSRMRNYMPSMIRYVRKRSGWIMWLENIAVAIITAVYVSAIIALIVWTLVRFTGEPVILAFWFLICLGACLSGGIFYKGAQRLMYRNDSGLHNLEGYDPETGTVPELEAAGFDTSKFWC